jgi:hypothetical protein
MLGGTGHLTEAALEGTPPLPGSQSCLLRALLRCLRSRAAHRWPPLHLPTALVLVVAPAAALRWPLSLRPKRCHWWPQSLRPERCHRWPQSLRPERCHRWPLWLRPERCHRWPLSLRPERCHRWPLILLIGCGRCALRRGRATGGPCRCISVSFVARMPGMLQARCLASRAGGRVACPSLLPWPQLPRSPHESQGPLTLITAAILVHGRCTQLLQGATSRAAVPRSSEPYCGTTAVPRSISSDTGRVRCPQPAPQPMSAPHYALSRWSLSSLVVGGCMAMLWDVSQWCRGVWHADCPARLMVAERDPQSGHVELAGRRRYVWAVGKGAKLR